ncbi:MAG: transporter substrate-binding domain-containing protein, partial [Rubrivivax sp.]
MLHRLTLFALSAFLLTASAWQPAHAGPVMDRVKAAGKVRVCIWPDYYGITWRNPRNQQLTGIDIDLSLEFGKDLKLPIQHVDGSFATLLDDLKGDRCDVAMYAVGMLPQRMELLRFSRPYMQSDI